MIQLTGRKREQRRTERAAVDTWLRRETPIFMFVLLHAPFVHGQVPLAGVRFGGWTDGGRRGECMNNGGSVDFLPLPQLIKDPIYWI